MILIFTIMKQLLMALACLAIVLSGISNNGLNAQTKTSDYKIANRIQLPGDGGWDYLTVDETGGRVFVSHGMIVQAVDLKTKAPAGTIENTTGVHGIAIADDLNKGYISNGRDTSVTVFDLKTLKFLSRIKVTGMNPDAILYDRFSHHVFTFNGRTSNSTVIDANTDKVVGTIALDGKPEFSQANGKGKVYVNIEDKSEVCIIDSKLLKVEKTWSIAPGEEPSGLALDKENHRLFSVCSNKLMVVSDAESGKVITTLPIGERCDGVAFDPGIKRIYSSNGVGTMTIVQQKSKDSYEVIGTFETQKGAKTIAVDTKSHSLYLTNADYEASTPSKDNPRQRPAVKPNTFVVLEIQCLK
jgi:DNA-binding beta-propeller fold protein YncE